MPVPEPRLVSVIVPMRNEEAHLAQQLRALAGQTYTGPWELVVVDNGSTDGSIKIVEAWRERFPASRRRRVVAGRGLNYARNRGGPAPGGTCWRSPTRTTRPPRDGSRASSPQPPAPISWAGPSTTTR